MTPWQGRIMRQQTILGADRTSASICLRMNVGHGNDYWIVARCHACWLTIEQIISCVELERQNASSALLTEAAAPSTALLNGGQNPHHDFGRPPCCLAELGDAHRMYWFIWPLFGFKSAPIPRGLESVRHVTDLFAYATHVSDRPNTTTPSRCPPWSK